MNFTTACKDWEARIVNGDKLIPFDPLFPEAAAECMDILNELILVDVAGSPRFGDVAREWIVDFAQAIFGSYDDENGDRLIQEFFMLISKKNAKSTSAAMIMLTALLFNWRKSAEFLILAPTIEVANNSFQPAQDAIEQDERLQTLLHVQGHTRTITNRNTNATLKIVAADNETVSGKKATGVLIDEFWLFGKKNNAQNMIAEAVGGLASRPEGFVIYLTTQSDEPPAGVFKSKLEYARKVRDGEIKDNKFLPVLYEFPKKYLANKKYLDPDNFYITNPNLGASVGVDFLERKIRNAEFEEDSINAIYAKHLNIEIGLSLRADRWAGADFWVRAGDKNLTLDEIIKRSEVIDVGIDGGGLDDLLGMTVIGREIDTGSWLSWSYAWAHPQVLKRRKSIATKLKDFKKDGDLTLVKKIGDDVREVAAIVAKIEGADLLDKVGVDPAGIGAILDALEDANIDEEKIVGISQGWRLGGAIKTAERRLAEGKLKHCARPLMNWCVGNARIEERANSILITKQASGTAKIDPLMALFNAVHLMALNPDSMKEKYQLFGM